MSNQIRLSIQQSYLRSSFKKKLSHTDIEVSAYFFQGVFILVLLTARESLSKVKTFAKSQTKSSRPNLNFHLLNASKSYRHCRVQFPVLMGSPFCVIPNWHAELRPRPSHLLHFTTISQQHALASGSLHALPFPMASDPHMILEGKTRDPSCARVYLAVTLAVIFVLSSVNQTVL